MSTLAIDNPNTLIAVFPDEEMYDIERVEASIGAPFAKWEDYNVTLHGLFVKVEGKWYGAIQPHRVWNREKQVTMEAEILLVPERIEGGVK